MSDIFRHHLLRTGVSAEISLLLTLRRLRTGLAASQMNDMVGLGTSTILSKFRITISAILSELGPRYLKSLTVADQRILNELDVNARRGFPGCIGSLDCMHVRWAKCPKQYQAAYKGKEGFPTVVVQAVALHDLYCSHIFVGHPGAGNDLNVLSADPFFQKITYSGCESFAYRVGDRTFSTPYYLTDLIYPTYPIFARPISTPQSSSEHRYTKEQESTRKDVERLFGVVQSRFCMVRSGAYRFEGMAIEDIKRCILVCFLIHNMIVSDAAEYDWGYDDRFVSSLHFAIANA